jgi:hypothetical protein
VILTVETPAGVVWRTVIAPVLVHGGVHEVSVAAVAPLGSPLTEKETAVELPDCGATENEKEVEMYPASGLTACAFVAPKSENANGTGRVTVGGLAVVPAVVTASMALPEVPFTFFTEIVYVPAEIFVPAVVHAGFA